jgi:arabinogalactan oligomer / maltooligosaccharide transport system permease protein
MSNASTAVKGRASTGQVVNNRAMRLAIRYIILTLGSIFSLYPFLIIVCTAFSTSNSISGAQLIPQPFSLRNFELMLSNPQTPILLWLRNSIFVSVTSTILVLALSTLAAYSFSRYRFRGRQQMMLGTLILQVFPNAVAITAFYLLLQGVGEIAPAFGLSSLGGLILVYLGGALGANVWLMKGYFDTIPRDLDEAAQVDGATHWVTFTQVILPLVRPILAVTAIFSFIGTFNDFLLPRVLLIDQNSKTLAVGLTSFLNNQFNQNWGVFAAGALFGTVPIILAFLILQTQIVSGLSAGAVKG